MTFEHILASIKPSDVRYTIMSDADIADWAGECVLIFNNPPAVETPRLVEAIGRQFAERLHFRMGKHLPPSIYRLSKALAGKVPDADENTRRQIQLWCEVTLFYLSELPR